jgi:peptidoglycan hydrolase-like protein with peptidoglycan-binding domain
MTAAVLTQLPLAAGSAVAASLGRAARWGLSQYARAPLSNTAVLGLATFALMASTNALYFQAHRHPAPLFGEHEQLGELAPVPAAPVQRPKAKPKAQPVQTTGSVPTAVVPATQPIGNADVFELQRKLQAIGLFDGTVDGLYGPRTAKAIRSFEEREGLKPKGELTRQILTAILAAPITIQPAAAATLPAPEPVPEQPVVMTESLPAAAPLPRHAPQPAAAPQAIPAPQAVADPLPAPAPLQPAIQTASAGRAPSANRPLPATPGEALEIASGVAGNAVDALVAAVNGDVQLGPAQPLPPKAQPVEVPPELAAPSPQASAAPEGEDQVAALVTAEMPPVATVPQRESKDPALIAKVQRGLSSLGFLSGKVDGKPGEATAKAIRNFEVWNNYDVTGRVTPELLELLVGAGAEI